MKYVAFLRAINVAGHASISMSDVRRAFDAAGCRNVRTYIQSGNVIFESSARPPHIVRNVRGKLRKALNVEPEILLRTAGDVEELIKRAPFKHVGADTGIKLYVAFLFKKPPRKPHFPVVSSTEALEAVAMSDREVFLVSRRKKSGFFGFPNNFVEERLGVTATSRNWTTVTKLVALARVEPDA